jgi:hypothetical protein
MDTNGRLVLELDPIADPDVRVQEHLQPPVEPHSLMRPTKLISMPRGPGGPGSSISIGGELTALSGASLSFRLALPTTVQNNNRLNTAESSRRGMALILHPAMRSLTVRGSVGLAGIDEAGRMAAALPVPSVIDGLPHKTLTHSHEQRLDLR